MACDLSLSFADFLSAKRGNVNLGEFFYFPLIDRFGGEEDMDTFKNKRRFLFFGAFVIAAKKGKRWSVLLGCKFLLVGRETET